jgi:glycosyltransferase involved in cell wall biosynthesis
MNPLVTVVVTTFNQSAYIEATIQSVLAQTYRNREIVVVDDGSSDDTPERLATFGDQITCIRQANAGVAGSRNTGVRHARGELVAFLDGDDLWEAEKLAVQVAAFAQYPAAGMIVVDALQFSGTEILYTSAFGARPRPFLGDPGQRVVNLPCYGQLLEDGIMATTSQVMVPAHVLKDVGLSDAAFRVSSDYDLYLRIAEKYSITFVKEVLACYRYVPTSACGLKETRALRCADDMMAVLRKHARQASPQWRSVIDETLYRKVAHTARMAYYRGSATHRRWASWYLMRMAVRNPLHPSPIMFLGALWTPAPVAALFGRRLSGARAIQSAGLQ